MVINGLMVAIGAIFGVLGRAFLSKNIDKEKSSGFPIATFTINMIGCLALGVVVALPLNPHLLLMLTTGLIGTFTTFSTFNVENLNLLRKKRYALLLSYASSTYVFGILLIYTGMIVVQLIV